MQDAKIDKNTKLQKYEPWPHESDGNAKRYRAECNIQILNLSSIWIWSHLSLGILIFVCKWVFGKLFWQTSSGVWYSNFKSFFTWRSWLPESWQRFVIPLFSKIHFWKSNLQKNHVTFEFWIFPLKKSAGCESWQRAARWETPVQWPKTTFPQVVV